jgi:hypothetical protein
MIDISCILSDNYIYSPHILPDDCEWVGAIANADGFNGHAYVANVVRCPQNTLWVFTVHGRFRINEDFFSRKKISDSAVIGAPYHLNPVG